jgi:hypothetical protein
MPGPHTPLARPARGRPWKDVDAALDALRGPVVYRALTGAPIPRSFVDGLVADILGRHLVTTGTGRAAENQAI